MAESGSYCSLFASNNNITTTELYNWNTVLGDNGASCNTESVQLHEDTRGRADCA